jgi:hypothetical protein
MNVYVYVYVHVHVYGGSPNRIGSGSVEWIVQAPVAGQVVWGSGCVKGIDAAPKQRGNHRTRARERTRTRTRPLNQLSKAPLSHEHKL